MNGETDTIYRISQAVIRKRHYNTSLGIVLAIALCAIALQGHVDDSSMYNETLLFSIVVFVALFGLVNLAGHIRYVLRSRKHHLVVGKDRITFVTGDDQSVLLLSDVALAERQSRRREGPSLMMQLKNKRIVRLVGYDRQDELIEAVTTGIDEAKSSVTAGD